MAPSRFLQQSRCKARQLLPNVKTCDVKAIFKHSRLFLSQLTQQKDQYGKLPSISPQPILLSLESDGLQLTQQKDEYRQPSLISPQPILLGLESDGLQLKISDNIQYSLSHHQCRENCRCDLCTVQPSRHRNVNNSTLTKYTDSFNDIYIKQAGIDLDHKYIYLTWSDDHYGWIDLDELLNEDDENTLIETNWKFLPHQLWTDCPPNMIHYDYNDIMVDDEILYESFYTELEQNGLCLIRNATAIKDTVISVGERLANHLYPTVFGPSFIVDIVPDSINPAFTNIALPTHTDLPYYVSPPEYFVFHCIKNQSTGNSIYNDGFSIAEEIRTHYPEQFEVLSTIAVPFRDHQKGKWDFSSWKKIIELNPENEKLIDKIHYNESVRSSIHWKINNDIKKDFYYALSIFSKMTRSNEFIFERQMESGDIFVFNNSRILHGRRAFEGGRKMQGCYFTTQAMMAMKRQLRFKLTYLQN